MPSDSPATRADQPAGDDPPPSSPGPPASADGREVLADTQQPTAARLLRRPDRWRKQGFGAGAARRPAPKPWTARVDTSRTSPWHTRHARSPSGRPLPPGCGRRTPARTPSPPIRSSCGHPAVAGRVTDTADLSSVRSAGHPPGQCDHLANGYGPSPDGGGQAADTSSAQRPTMSGQPTTANHTAPTSWP
jgi:hypothetical protein